MTSGGDLRLKSQQPRPRWAGQYQTVKTKTEKRNQARKNAEAVKAARKTARQTKSKLAADTASTRKGKSIVPQSKSRAKK